MKALHLDLNPTSSASVAQHGIGLEFFEWDPKQ
jgi:hypothetical protein